MTEQPTKNQTDEICFNIAIAGQSPLFTRLCRIIESPDFTDFMPEVRIKALLLREGVMDDKYLKTCRLNPPVFASARELFDGVPDLRLVLDISSGGRYEAELRRDAPHGVNLLSPPAVLFICRALEDQILGVGAGTKLSQLRNSFLTMLNQMDEDIFIMDHEGIVLEVNDFFLQRRNAGREDFVGLHCRDLEGEELCCIDDENVTCPWDDPESGQNRFSKIYNRITSEGAMQYWRVLLFPLPSTRPDDTRYIFMRKDITQFISLQQRVQQTEKMAAIGELSTFIAHEIRNPLFSIGGFANSLLRTEGLDEQARQKAQVILEESQRLDDILKSILNFAKPVEREMGEINVGRVVKETAQLMRIGDQERNIQTTLNVPHTLPKARGNADLLKQGLINIIKNAQEAMPDGGDLIISAGTHGHMLEVSVRDTGCGINPDNMKQIFNPFFSTKNKGAGLGLGMTKKGLEDMGGKLEIESEPGKGTTVRMLLLPMLAASAPKLDMIYEPGKGTSLNMKLPPGS